MLTPYLWGTSLNGTSTVGMLPPLDIDTSFGDIFDNLNVEVFFNRRFGKNKALNLGYRYFVDDYDNLPTYAWDMKQQGPVVGYTWSF